MQAGNDVEQRMGSGEPFTYGDLCKLTRDNDKTRLADKAIQRWRRRGWISFIRVGRQTIWTLTDTGKAALAVGASL